MPKHRSKDELITDILRVVRDTNGGLGKSQIMLRARLAPTSIRLIAECVEKDLLQWKSGFYVLGALGEKWILWYEKRPV